MILAGDVGATKILLEVGMARSDGWEPSFSRRYAIADFDGMDSVLEAFLREMRGRDHRGPPIRAAGRATAEDIASGMGLSAIHRALTDRDATPVQITSQAFDKRDPTCTNVLDIFWECLGNIAGDHALAVLARGGVFIGGGVTARIAPSINFSRFRSAFCAKGAMSSILMKIPVRAITNENLAVLGAARIASRAM